MMTTTTSSADDTDIETWRDIHRHLTLAIIQSRDNVAAELAKRRYLLEEINRSPAGGPPPSQGSLPTNKKVPKKASAGKHNKNTMASIKQGKQLSMKYPSANVKIPSAPLPVANTNNSLPTPHS
jgi:hypothetical protein